MGNGGNCPNGLLYTSALFIFLWRLPELSGFLSRLAVFLNWHVHRWCGKNNTDTVSVPSLGSWPQVVEKHLGQVPSQGGIGPI